MRLLRLVSLLFLAALAPRRGSAEAPHTVTVAVAANMKPAFEEIAARFQATNPGAEVKPVFGASGNFYAQIENGAPFDLFLSADTEFPAKVVEKGLADGPAFVYAYGKLVVWVPKGSTVNLEAKGLAALADPAVGKVAIANPDVAPYGRAARQALEKAGVWQRLEGRVVVGQNVAQAAQFAQSGNAQAGFVPLSLASVPPLSEQGRAWLVPPSDYERIAQAGVVIKGAKQAVLARELASFLAGPEARAVLEKLGYELPAR